MGLDLAWVWLSLACYKAGLDFNSGEVTAYFETAFLMFEILFFFNTRVLNQLIDRKDINFENKKPEHGRCTTFWMSPNSWQKRNHLNGKLLLETDVRCNRLVQSITFDIANLKCKISDVVWSVTLVYQQ